jgi:serine phosphatase RsbU (regulator of sigma subunit)/pSer/pThr/pTyr-binding forkhead associated (FHA) protein
MASLHFLKGPNQGQRVDLCGDKVVLGRNPDCQVVIPVTSVSREHAQIVRQGGKYFIEDLRSRNHTFLNNREVTQRTPLKDNDCIRICDCLVSFHDGTSRRLPPDLGPGPEDPESDVQVLVHVRVRSVQPLVWAGGVNVPDYMAPQQIDEPPEGPVKAPADDLHALGVMAYQMLVGDLPFPAQGLAEKLDAIAHRRFERAAERYSPESRLAALIDRCLAGSVPDAATLLREVRSCGPAKAPKGGAAAAPRAALAPRPGEAFHVVRLLFEDVITEAYEAEGRTSGARVTLRLFKPTFQSPAFVELVRGLPASGSTQDLDAPPGILRRFHAGRVRQIPVQVGGDLTISRDLDGEGCLCLVEEYAGRETLMDAIRSGQLPGDEPRILRILEQVLESLRYAHQHGCVHGNLTPYCLFLGPGDTVKVEGFGLHAEVELLRMEAGGDATTCTTVEKRAQSQSPQPAKLAALLEISGDLSKTLEVDGLMPLVADSLFRLFRQADRCFIIQAQEGNQKLFPRLVRTRRQQDEADARFSRSLARKCLETNQAFLSEDATADNRFSLSQSIADVRIRSVMCAPLCDADERAFGVVQVDTQNRIKKFTQEDLTLFVSVANLASVALANARFHEELAAQERRKCDLELASRLQLTFVPRELPRVPGYEFFAHYEPALNGGGDYYGFVPLADGRLAVAVGDVAGKGVPAALLMARLSSDAPFSLLTEADPARAMAALNGLLFPHTSPMDRFITLALAVLDPQAHTLTLVNGGHPSPLLYRRSDGSLGEAVPRDLVGLPLGMAGGVEYASCRVVLEPGDSLLLFTDGVPEARDVKDVLFGTERVRSALDGGPPSAQALGERVIGAVKQHAAGRSQFDDITLVCVSRTG